MLRALLALAVVLPFLSACAGTECTVNSQCHTRQYCRANRCMYDCRADIDCPTGQVCSLIGMCTGPTDGGPSDGGARDMPVPPGDMFTPPADMFTPPADMFTPPADLGTPKPYLADCTTDAECASHHCIAEGPGTSHVCSKSCSVDDDCADWHFCNAGTCNYDDTGVGCSSTSTTDCNFACLYAAPHRGRCTHLCTSAADCAGGYACVYSSPGDTTSLKVCALIHSTCDTDSSQCDTSLGFCGAGSTSQCTGNCSSVADCPPTQGPTYSCGPVSGATFNVCIPPGPGNGGPGTICGTNADCRSGICATPDGGPIQYCLERCTPTGGCEDGYGCIPVLITGLGVAHNICVAAGRGRSPDPCSTGTDCRSGACGSTSHHCLDSCLNGFCPPATACTSDALTVDGYMLRSCR